MHKGPSLVFALAALLAAGCLGDAPPAGEEPLGPAAPPASPPGFAVEYRCPGDPAPQPRPCGTAWPGAAGMTLADVAVRSDPPLIAMLGTYLVSGIAGGAAPAEPLLQLLTSTDGVRWAQHPIPSVPNPNTRTGSSGPFGGAMAFAPDGRLHLVLVLNGDTERSFVGGAVPDAMQPRTDVAALAATLGADGSPAWGDAVMLSDGPADSAAPKLAALSDGTLFATWMDYPGTDIGWAWSGDGTAWTLGETSRFDCWQTSITEAAPGLVALACSDAYFLEPLRVPALFLANLTAGTLTRVEAFLGEPPADLDSEGTPLPACGAVQIHSEGAGGLLMVLSRCPDIQVLASADGVSWNETARFGPADLGFDGGWGSDGLLAAASARDADGRLHMLAWATRQLGAPFCNCPETLRSHAVVDPFTGEVMHTATFLEPPMDEALAPKSVADESLPYSIPHLGLDGDMGWLAWSESQPRFGWIDATTA